jgi:hypothetical protein
MKKPFYRTFVWWRLIISCAVGVVGLGFASMCGRMLLQVTGGHKSSLYQMCTYIMSGLNYPVFGLWDLVGKLMYDGNTDQMFGLIPAMLLSFVLWWVFLGAVLGTFCYFIFCNRS